MSKGHLDIFLEEELFLLLPQRALYRPGKRQLVISDLHLGKTTHFRKQGLALPEAALAKDIDKLHYLLNLWQPESVLLLGDLFHSDYNREWLWFKSLLMEYPLVQFILVEGNHDILQDAHYSLPNLLKAGFLVEENFIFSHHPLENAGKLNVCGHVHPGIRIEGMARQSVSLPCFYLTPKHFILPAFGYLTGLHILEKEAGARYYLVANDRVILL
jgi:uncharacterized protein